MGEPRPDQAWLVRVLAALVVVPIGLTIWLTDWSSLWTAMWTRHFPLWLSPVTGLAVVLQGIAGRLWSSRPSLALVPGELRGYGPPLFAVTPAVGFCPALVALLFPNPLTPVFVLLGVFWVMMAALFVVRPSAVAVSARGVSLRRLPGMRTLCPWEQIDRALALVPSRTVAGAMSGVRGVELRLTPAARRRKMVVVANMVDVRFLADVIEYYRLHPEERSEIGTLDGYHRMTGALTDWYRAQPAVRR